MKNIFKNIVKKEDAKAVSLGNPLGVGSGPFMRRMNEMAAMTGGNGFRTPKKGPKLSKGGATRKERRKAVEDRYLANCRAEEDFRKSAKAGGASIREINEAIERREHLS